MGWNLLHGIIALRAQQTMVLKQLCGCLFPTDWWVLLMISYLSTIYIRVKMSLGSVQGEAHYDTGVVKFASPLKPET